MQSEKETIVTPNPKPKLAADDVVENMKANATNFIEQIALQGLCTDDGDCALEILETGDGFRTVVAETDSERLLFRFELKIERFALAPAGDPAPAAPASG